MGSFRETCDFVIRPTHSRTTGILTILILISAVFLTVTAAQQQQITKPRAASLYIATCKVNSDCSQSACVTSICLSNNTCQGNYKPSGTICSADTVSSGVCDNVGNCVEDIKTGEK